MIKLILANATLGGAVFFAGAMIHDFSLIDIDGLGKTLAYIGIGYAAISISLFVVPLYKLIEPHIREVRLERTKSKAYEDILRYKKLHNENIISDEEFEDKSRELKARIL